MPHDRSDTSHKRFLVRAGHVKLVKCAGHQNASDAFNIMRPCVNMSCAVTI